MLRMTLWSYTTLTDSAFSILFASKPVGGSPPATRWVQ
jgi:hypothetical protein